MGRRWCKSRSPHKNQRPLVQVSGSLRLGYDFDTGIMLMQDDAAQRYGDGEFF